MKTIKFFLGLILVLVTPACAQQNTNDFTISIALNNTVKTINGNIFGTNIEWIQDGDLLWNTTTDTPNSNLWTNVTALQPTVLRFPGGTYSDFYNWQDGVGPVADRPNRQPTPLDTRVFDNGFGTDEFLTFSKDLNAQPMITVNIGTGTSTEAADWVRYCNITRNIKKVQYWELGNEIYLNSDPTSSSITETPSAYAQKALEFAEAMKEVDPSIKIMAIGGANTGLYDMIQYPGWDEAVLQTVGPYMDFLAVHNSYYPLIMDNGTYSDAQIYPALFGADTLIKANLDQVSSDISTYAPAYQNKIQIAVTEWGPLFTALPGGAYTNDTRTMGSAIYIALVLKTYLSYNKVGMVNFFKLSGSDFMSLVQSTTQYPSYYAIQFFSNGFGTNLLSTQCISGTYNTTVKIGVVPPLNGVPLLEAIASKDASGNIYVIAINKDIQTGHNCLIKFNNSTIKLAGPLSLLSAQNISSQNATVKTSNISGTGQVTIFLPAYSIAKLKLQIVK